MAQLCTQFPRLFGGLGRAASSLQLTTYQTVSASCRLLHKATWLQGSPKSATSASMLDKEELTLTDACVKQINKVSDAAACLRVVVESGGCSGFQYKFELDPKVNDDDRIFEKDGARVVIDRDSLELVRGSVVDFKMELIRSSFSIASNPQAENGCSCGASFNVKI